MTTHNAERIFHADVSKIILRTDRMFFWLLIAQWIGAILVALIWSPRTWIAQYWSIHQHVIAATVLGGLFAAYPLALIVRRPGARYTRHMIAIGQMLQSALLVHVTGGRIETHFHVFGSLALLAFYRDWPVLITGSAVVYVDHLALGAWFPLSVYGVPSATIWRAAEHAVWVVFEDVFLIMSCRKGIQELRAIAEREAALQDVKGSLEARVQDRTQQLRKATESLEEEVQQRTKELVAAKVGLEGEVAKRTQEVTAAKQSLEEKVQQLEMFNRIMMNREERILELKKELAALKARRGGAGGQESGPAAQPVQEKRDPHAVEQNSEEPRR